MMLRGRKSKMQQKLKNLEREKDVLIRNIKKSQKELEKIHNQIMNENSNINLKLKKVDEENKIEKKLKTYNSELNKVNKKIILLFEEKSKNELLPEKSDILIKEQKIPDHKDIKNQKDYQYELSESVKNFKGFEGILTKLPKFYKILCNISSDKKCPWSAKMLIHSALANLVLREDLIDDSIGPEGYLDDLFLCAYVLKEIRDRISKELILENVGDSFEKDKIFDIIYDVYEKSSFYLGDKTDKILTHVGIQDFKSFDYLYKDVSTYNLDRLRNKLMLLYAMLAIKTKEVIRNPSVNQINYGIQRYIIGSPYFSEINRYINFVK